MIISEGTTVTISYTLTLDNGECIEEAGTQEALSYIQGTDELIFGLEQALVGKTAGDNFQVSIPPEEGYGAIIEDALIEVPLDHLPEEARQLGAVLTAVGPEGQELEGCVTALADATATLDFNHPLAGQNLHFDITVLAVEVTEASKTTD